jgi:DNA modification methylase
MEYITVKDAAEKWGISERRISTLCSEGRIEGAQRFGWSWAIPEFADKPTDARKKDFEEGPSASKSRSGIEIERIWAMPNKNTFDIKPIKNLILSELTDGLWIDPFANKNKLASVTNDLNPDFDTDYHMDALDFMKMFDTESVDGVLYDPPYSPRQVSECYNDVGYNVTWDTTKASFWGNHKREISRIVKVGGKVITFGWNSGGIGAKYGFKIERILLVPHGGWHNDTICTVEVKVKSNNDNESEDMNITFDDLQNNSEDEALINKIKSLPIDYWDFRNDDTRELTHGLHTYPAVMIYPISRNIISLLKGITSVDTLLDPFSGSGTVLVEGQLAGIKSIYGNDLNPLAKFISEVKTKPIDSEDLLLAWQHLNFDIEDEYLKYSGIVNSVNDYFIGIGIDLAGKDDWGENAFALLKDYLNEQHMELDIPNFKKMGYWFKPSVIIELQIIKNCISSIENDTIRNFTLLAFSECIRLVSNRRNGEFKMYRMAPDKVRAFNPDVKKEFYSILERNIDKMNDYSSRISNAENSFVKVFASDSRVLPDIEDESVDLVITSPPYGDSRTTVAYGEFSRLSLQWIDLYETQNKDVTKIDKSLMGGSKYRNGFEFNLSSETLKSSLEQIFSVDIERAGDVYSFYKDLDEAIKTISQKTKKGGYHFWVVGNRTVKGVNLKTDKIIAELGNSHNLRHLYTIERNISNKVMPNRNSPTNKKGKTETTMTKEYIVIMKKA